MTRRMTITHKRIAVQVKVKYARMVHIVNQIRFKMLYTSK